MEFEANNCDEETTDATNKNTNSKGKITANTDVEQIKLENQTTKQLYASLLHEYEETRHQLAEARLHIDRLRLGANVDIHKHYILNHNTVENATIRPRISAIVDCNTLPTITLPLPATRLIANTIVNDKHVCKAAMMTENGTQCYQDITTSEDEDDTIIEPHNTSENLQQIAKLQHRLAALHDKTKDSDISLDDIYSELIDLHQLHQDLASNVNSWKETNGNDDDDNKMVEDELIKLAQQLQEFTGLLKLKSQQLIQASQDKKRENTELSLQSNTASDSNLEIHGCNHEVPAHFFIATKSNTQSLTSDFTESNASSANSLTLQKHQMYIPEDIENTFKTEISYHEPQTISPSCYTHAHIRPQTSSQTQTQMNAHSPSYQTHTHINPQTGNPSYWDHTNTECQTSNPSNQTYTHMERHMSSPSYQTHSSQSHTHTKPQTGYQPHSSQTQTFMEPQTGNPSHETHTHTKPHGLSNQNCTHMRPHSLSNQTHTSTEPQTHSTSNQIYTHTNPQTNSPSCHHTEPQIRNPSYQICTHTEGHQTGSPPYQTHTHMEPQPQCSSPLYQTHTHANPQSDSLPYQTRTHMEPQSGSPPYQTHSHMEPQCSSPLYQNHTHANPQSDSPPYQTRTHMEPQSGSPPYQTHSHMEPQCSSPLYQTHTHANLQSDSPPYQTRTHMEPQSGSPPYQTHSHMEPQCSSPLYQTHTHANPQSDSPPYQTHSHTEPQCSSPLYQTHTHANLQSDSPPYQTRTHIEPQPQCSSPLYQTHTHANPQSDSPPYQTRTHMEPQSGSPPYQTHSHMEPQCSSPLYQTHTHANPQSDSPPYQTRTHMEPQPQCSSPLYQTHTHANPQSDSPPCQTCTHMEPQSGSPPWTHSPFYQTRTYVKPQTNTTSRADAQTHLSAMTPLMIPVTLATTNKWLPSPEVYYSSAHVNTNIQPSSPIKTLPVQNNATNSSSLLVGTGLYSSPQSTCTMTNSKIHQSDHPSQGPVVQRPQNIHPMTVNPSIQIPTLNSVNNIPVPQAHNPSNMADLQHQILRTEVNPSLQKPIAPNHVSVGPTTTPFNDISTASFSQQFKAPSHVSVGPTTTLFNDISTASFSQQFKAPNHVSVGPTTTPFNDISTASFSQQFKEPNHVSVGPTTTSFNDISTASFSQQFKAPNHVSVGPTTTSFNDISTASFSQQFKEPNHVSVGPTTTPFNDISTASFSQQFKAPNHVSVGPTTTPFNDILTASFSQQFKAPSHVSVGPTTTPFNDISTASFSKQFKAPNHVSVGPTTTSFNDISTASFSQQFKEPNHVSVGPTTTSFNDISTASFSQQFKAPNHVSVCPTTTPFNDILTASFSQQQFKAPNQVSVVPITTPFNDISNDTFSQQFKPQSAHNLQPQQHPTPIISSMQTPMHYIPTTDQLHSSLPAPVTTMYLPPYSAPITAASVSFSGTSKHHKPLRPSSLPHNSMDNLHSLYNTPSINDMYQEQPMYTSNAQSHDKSHDRFPLSVHTSSNQRLTELTKSCYPSLSGIDVSNQRTVYPSDAPSIMAIHQKPSNTQPFLVQESSNQGNHTNDDSTMRSTPVDTPRSSHQLTKNQRAVHSTSKPTGYDRQKGSSSNIVSPSSVERPPRHRIVPYEKEPVTSQSLHYDIDSDSSGSTDHKLGPERTRTKHRHPKDEKGQAGYNRRAQKGKSTISKPKERPSTTSLENTKTLKRVLPHIPSPPRPESFKTSQQNWPDQKNKGLIPVQHHFATEMDSGFVESEDTRHQQNPSPLVYPGDTYQSVLSSEDENHHSIDHERDRRDTDVSSVASSKASHNTVAAIDSLRQDFVNLKEELQSIMQKPDTQEVSKSLRIDNSEPEQQYKTGKVSTPLQLSKPAHKRHRGEKVTLNKSHRKRLHKRGVDKAITACPVQHDKETQASFLNTSHTHNTSNRIRSKDQPQKIIHRYKPIIRSSSSLESLSSSIETTLNQDSSVTSLSTIVTPVRKHTAKKYWQQYSESEDSIVRGSKYTGTSNNGSRLSSENSDNEHKGNSKYQFRSSSRKPTQILTTYDSSPHHYMEDTEQTILLSLPQRPKPKHKEFHKSRPNSSGTHILESTPTTMRTRKSHHNVRPIPPHSNIPNPPHIYCNNNKRHTHFSVPHNEDHNHCDTCYPHPTNLTRSLSNISELHTRENRNQPQRTIILETLPFSSIAKVVDTNSRDQLPIVSFDEQTRDQLPVVAVDEQTRDTLPVVAFDEHTKVILDTVSLDEAEELAVKLKRSSERINRNLRDKMSLSN